MTDADSALGREPFLTGREPYLTGREPYLTGREPFLHVITTSRSPPTF